jgi:hypothetical protein
LPKSAGALPEADDFRRDVFLDVFLADEEVFPDVFFPEVALVRERVAMGGSLHIQLLCSTMLHLLLETAYRLFVKVCFQKDF